MKAISSDGLFFSIFKTVNGNGIAMWNVWIHCVFLAIVTFFADLEQLASVISLGNLLSYSLTNASCMGLRYCTPNPDGTESRSEMIWFVWLFYFSSILFAVSINFKFTIYVTMVGIFFLLIAFFRVFLAP